MGKVVIGILITFILAAPAAFELGRVYEASGVKYRVASVLERAATRYENMKERCKDEAK